MKELTIQENQQAALEIIKKVAKICEQEHLRYWLAYGTLIGAIRHNGFIPWDDDVDIMMPREDHDRLLAWFAAHPDVYPELQAFSADGNPEYPYMISRISDRRYVLDVDNEKGYGMGTFIDVYPMDGCGNDYDKAMALAKKGNRLSSLCYQSTREHFEMGLTKSPLKKLIKYPAYLGAKLMGKNFWMNRLRGLIRVYDYDSSDYACCTVWCSNPGKDFYKRELFDELISHPYEDGEFLIPARYDELLRLTYGDYMQLPPEEDRVGHHFYRTYRRDED